MRGRLNLFLLLAICLLPLAITAHGGSSEQLKSLTEQIQRAPGNVDLYLRRGDLYRQIGNAKAALEDFEMVGRLSPERAEVDVIDAIHMGECGLHVLEDVDEIVLIEVSELEVSQNDAEPLLDELEETG